MTTHDSHDVANAVRVEVILAAIRGVTALATVVLLFAARPAGARIGQQVAVHIALAVATVLVGYAAHRLTTRLQLERLALAVTAFDLAFWVLYDVSFHAHPGSRSLMSVFVLVEAAMRFRARGTVLAAVLVDVVALAWPQHDAAGRTLTAAAAVALTVLIAGGTYVAAHLVRRQSSVQRHGVRRLTDAFAYASIGLAVVDERGLVEAANPALAALLGEEPDALAGVPMVDLVEPAARAELERVAAEVRAGTSVGARFEARVRQAEGRGRWALVALSRGNDPAAGERLVVQVEDIHDRKAVEAKLAHQASHDMLTGLPNRAELLGLMGAAFEAKEPMALLFIDLDRFKWVNDSLGHEAGDLLLIEVADRLRKVLRPGDVVARLGGDEFVVLAHGVRQVSTAVAMADRVAAALRRPVVLPGDRESYASASIGIAISGPDDAPETLLRDADTAMYQAKAAGGAGYALFTPSLRAATVRHHEIEGALRRAVRAGELTVVYQPEVRVVDGTVRGFEALVRWHDSTWGSVGPNEFVPIAEESDLVLELGILVLRRALADAAAWPLLEDGTRAMVAINVSRRQLVQPGFPGMVAALLDEAGIPPSTVCLEVTETALTQNVESVITALHELRHLGLLIAIDDFGTGHASLTYLTKLPVDVLKVDRLFVSGLAVDQRSAAIVDAVAAMGRAFGLAVVAEGVEDGDQFGKLRSLDIDLAQGYLFSKPVPTAEAARLIAPNGPRPVAVADQPAAVRRIPGPRRPLPSDPGLDTRYRLMIDLARDVTGRLDLNTVLERTFAALHQLIEFTGGSVQLLDDTDHLRLVATDPPATQEALGMSVPLGQGIGGAIALTGEPRYLPDIYADRDVSDDRRKKATSGGVRSYFGVPLVTEGRVIGLLQIDSLEVDAWNDADRLVVLAFTPIVAAAVQNARKFERDITLHLRSVDTA